MESAQREISKRRQKKQNSYRIKFEEGKNITEILSGLATWKKNLKNSKMAHRLTYTWIRYEYLLIKYQIEKRQALMANMDSGFKNSRPSTTGILLNWIND